MPSHAGRLSVSTLIALVAASGGVASLALQRSSARSPLFWVYISSTVVIAFFSTYWSLGERDKGWQENDGSVWRSRLIAAVQTRVRSGLGGPDSLPAIAGSLIPLKFTALPQHVRPVATKRLADLTRRDLPTGHRINRLFMDYGDSLLVLGAPGAGKSRLLSELAAALLADADRTKDPLPPPVILSLASWAERRDPLERWLAKSLTQEYNIPERFSRSWSTTGALVVLLDGLDDVPPEYRAECIAAVNSYQRAHPGTGLVVCCRTPEYIESSAQLTLGGAVEIQPLDARQVRDYVASAGRKLAGLLALFDNDPQLREVLDTPLLLNIAALTYRGEAVLDIGLPGAVERRRELLLDEYLRQALEHWAPSPVPLSQRVRWLSWLAGNMLPRHQHVLHLLWMQPCLAEPATAARTVVVAAAAVSGLGGLVISGIFGAVLASLPHEVPIDMPRRVLYPLTVAYVTGIAAAAGYSRVFAPPIHVHWSRFGLRRELYRGGVVAVIAGLPVGTLFYFISGWRSGAASAAIFGIILALIVVIQRSLRTLRQQESEDGRRMTGRQIVRVVSRYAIPFGIVVGGAYGLVATLYFGVAVGVGQGAIITVAFSAFGSYFLWLAVGGRAYVQHYVLRFFLVRHRFLPSRLRRFLEDMVKATVMRPQSGGYAFMHDLLQVHLANKLADAQPPAGDGQVRSTVK